MIKSHHRKFHASYSVANFLPRWLIEIWTELMSFCFCHLSCWPDVIATRMLGPILWKNGESLLHGFPFTAGKRLIPCLHHIVPWGSTNPL